MTIIELKRELEISKIPKNMYSILKGGLPNEQLCLVKEEQDWQVYYSERGRKSGLKTFNTESNACEYFYNMLRRHI